MKKSFLIIILIGFAFSGCNKETLYSLIPIKLEESTGTGESEEVDPSKTPPAGTVWLFEDINYEGINRSVSGNEGAFDEDFNDKASSLKIGPNSRVTLFADESYQGAYKTFDEDIDNLNSTHDFDDKTSSLFVTEKKTDPIGDNAGSPFEDVPEVGQISKINVWESDGIDAIQVYWILPDSSEQEAPKRGGNGGVQGAFELQEGEYITEITGKYKSDGYIGNLTLHTNQGRSESFGEGLGVGSGETFSLEAPEGSAIIGFHGYSDSLLNGLGIFVRPISTLQ